MKHLKKIIYLLAIAAVWFTGCKSSSGYEGELIGVQHRQKWYEPQPYGMAFIPQGHFTMGPNDQDIPWSMTAQPKTITIDAFWMDITEITNNEYRQFVFWVRDSIAMELAITNGKDEFKIEKENPSPDDQRPYFLNWSERKNLWNKKDEDLQTALEPMYYSQQDAIFGEKAIDTRKLVYEYWYADIRQAAKITNIYWIQGMDTTKEKDKIRNKFIYDDLGNPETGELAEGHYNAKIISYDYDNFGKQKDFKNRSDIVMHVKIPIYPDTLVWIRDYTYSYNEPWARKYFWHPAYDDYPVVGINWLQAKAFSNWRTKIMVDDNRRNGLPPYEDYRLPTEAEWEYAARGGLNLAVYPWGGPYIRNYEGCLLANFKPMRGMYALDGAARTIAVAKYKPNDYGLYDMAGNVAEWCEDAYDDAAYSLTHDINPVYAHNVSNKDPLVLKRKVVRGGSWKDIGWYLQCGTRSYEYQDTAKAYIGFRNVRSYMGTDVSGYEGY